MAEERVIDRLLDFGLARDNSEIYLFLLRVGPSPARMVASNLGINRVRAYRKLKVLEEKGLVEVTMERPVKFVATPLEEVLDRRLEEAKVKFTGLEKKKEEIIKDWKKIFTVEARVEEPKFRVLQGRQHIYDLLIQMCGRAKAEIRFLTTGSDLYRFSFAGIDDKLKDLVKDGVKTRMLTQVEKSKLKAVEDYLEFAEGRHITLSAPTRLFIIDESESLTTADMDDSMSMSTRKDKGLWTNASSYVEAMKVFFDALWRAAPDAQEFVDAVKIGKAPEQIMMIGTREEYIETFRVMVGSGSKEVIIMEKRIQDLPLNIQDLQAVSDREVNVRILTQIDLEGLPDVRPIMELAQLMHNATAINLRLLVVDRREALLQIPSLKGKGQIVWSNLKAYVETMNQIFESYWREGVSAKDVIPELENQLRLVKDFKLAKEALESVGLAVKVPGELISNLGVKHSFSLVAKKPGQPDRTLVVDQLIGESASQRITELSAKAIDVKPAAKLLAAAKPLDEREVKLAELYGIKLIHSTEGKDFVADIMDEADKL